jgi:FtsP/CotA-like multicopper oxidase with cupredoxin domain
MDHPFHLHGFFFQVDGAPAWKDTVNVPGRKAVRLAIDVDAREGAAGGWMYHCHILEHAEGGMMGELHVQ